jgi:AcrR family transcriptional regulator
MHAPSPLGEAISCIARNTQDDAMNHSSRSVSPTPYNGHSTLEPRKTPVQARSAATVDAIGEATIQVLLSHGADRLTTTRVAERAGVSVGTLYQYYPNKQSLLFAVLEDHLNRVWSALEEACEQSRGMPLADMMKVVVERFVDAKMERTDISIALYSIASELGGAALVKRMGERARRALKATLRTAPDAHFPQEDFAVQMMLSAMAGTTRSVLEAGASTVMVRRLREQLVLLCQSYMAAVAAPRTQSPT